MQETVGLLYSIQQFLNLVNKTNIYVGIFCTSFTRYLLASPITVIDKSLEYNWIEIFNDQVYLTEKGRKIVQSKSPQQKLRYQLKDIITVNKPRWFPLIPNGRFEVSKYFPPNTYQCFCEADLFTSNSMEVIDWWDELASFSRDKKDAEMLSLGRVGEKLTVEYEQSRLGEEVIWQSIESNLSGFDVLSKVSNVDPTPLKIEVKTSVYNQHFFVTRNEWDTAQYSKQYLFYLWILEPTRKLYILNKDIIGENIPNNRGNGSWEIVHITLSKEELKKYLTISL